MDSVSKMAFIHSSQSSFLPLQRGTLDRRPEEDRPYILTVKALRSFSLATMMQD